MKELLRTDNPVRLSYLQNLLAQAGIDCVVLDAKTGALLPSGILPRLMVAEESLEEARQLLKEVGEEIDG